ncbi:nuclear transport factor 2 family protein [Gammaproteobacteria bacterium]|nr:nuclear transport factor 2 family protein [Gammaproteobacteria bacterium]
MEQEANIRQVIELYTEGTYEGDATKLEASFHEKAVMNGYLGGATIAGNPGCFYSRNLQVSYEEFRKFRL